MCTRITGQLKMRTRWRPATQCEYQITQPGPQCEVNDTTRMALPDIPIDYRMRKGHIHHENLGTFHITTAHRPCLGEQGSQIAEPIGIPPSLGEELVCPGGYNTLIDVDDSPVLPASVVNLFQFFYVVKIGEGTIQFHIDTHHDEAVGTEQREW